MRSKTCLRWYAHWVKKHGAGSQAAGAPGKRQSLHLAAVEARGRIIVEWSGRRSPLIDQVENQRVSMSNAIVEGATVVRLQRSDFFYYDQLPLIARQALANAVFDWSSGATFDRWTRGDHGHKTGSDLAARVAEWDALQIGLSGKQ
jgi:hypothetical protein